MLLIIKTDMNMEKLNKKNKNNCYVCFILFIVFSPLSASNILRLPKTNQAHFILKEENKKHSTSPYSISTVRSTFDCLDACTADEANGCKSVNVDESKDPLECQLVVNDRNTVDSYVDAPGVKHYDTGKTTLTLLKSHNWGGCIVPASLSCKAESTNLIYSSAASDCDELYAYFSFDTNTGRLTHHCTGLSVCPLGLGNGNKVFISNNCHQSDKEKNFLYSFRRDFRRYLFYNLYCISLKTITNEHGQDVVISIYCTGTSGAKTFDLPGIPLGSVFITQFTSAPSGSDFNAILNWGNFPNSYQFSGYDDDMVMIRPVDNYFALRMQAKFVAPLTGWYHFAAACNAQCVVYQGASDSSKSLIIQQTVYGEEPNPLNFETYTTQMSVGIYMTAGNSYYVELVYRETTGSDHAELGVKLPGRNDWIPVSSKYLIRL